MLPASIAPDIRRQVLHYLGATFNFRDRAVEQALQRFLNDGVFFVPHPAGQLQDVGLSVAAAE